MTGSTSCTDMLRLLESTRSHHVIPANAGIHVPLRSGVTIGPILFPPLSQRGRARVGACPRHPALPVVYCLRQLTPAIFSREG